MFNNRDDDTGYNSIPNSRGPVSQLSNLLSKNSSSMNLVDIINNFNQFDKIATNILPFIQHYGPFIKNLPTMWRLIKEFNSSETKVEDNKITKSISVKSAKFKSMRVKKDDIKDTLLANTNSNTEIPGPKLYI
jgi:hypothetical protein